MGDTSMFEQFNPLMTVQEVCEVLRVGKNTVYDLIYSNKIEGFRLGRTWKIKRDSLSHFILQESKLI